MPPEIHEQIEDNRPTYREDPSLVGTFRRYVRGVTDLELTDRQKEILSGITKHIFSDNIAHQIVAEGRDRLHLMRFDCEDKGVGEFLTNFYTLNRLKDRSGGIHYDALRDGNTVAALGWKESSKRVTVLREKWWDGTSGVYIHYDDEEQPDYAVKDWHTTVDNKQVLRRIVRYPDFFERWISYNSGASWGYYELRGEPAVVSWIKDDGTPLHIPYVHFPNSGGAGGSSDVYGYSELDGGIIALQDQINDIHLSLNATARMTAYQMLFMSGVSDPEVEYGPGQLIWVDKADARLQVIPGGDLSQQIALLDKKLERVAQISRTPVYILKGANPPSGEALMRAERPSIEKASEQIDTFTDRWSEVAHRAVEIQNRFGSGPRLNEDVNSASIRAVYSSPERRDPLSQSLIVNNLGERISIAEALRLMGYTQKQAESIMEEKAEEGKEAMKAMQDAFNAGIGPGTGLPGKGNAEEE